MDERPSFVTGEPVCSPEPGSMLPAGWVGLEEQETEEASVM